jgi:hypothetical protein
LGSKLAIGFTSYKLYYPAFKHTLDIRTFRSGVLNILFPISKYSNSDLLHFSFCNMLLTPTINGQNHPGLHVNPVLFDFSSLILFEEQYHADTAPDDGKPTSVVAG